MGSRFRGKGLIQRTPERRDEYGGARKYNPPMQHSSVSRPFRVWLCVPTFRRPDLLARCLDALAQTVPPDDAELALLVVDNDREGSAAAVFAEKTRNFPFPVRMVCEEKKGLPNARNRFMDLASEGGATHILWVDDDMILPPNYLRDLFAQMQRRRADAIRGRVRFEYDGGGSAPSRRAALFSRRPMLAGNGVLLSAKIFRDWGLRNDPRFMSGGEDGDFFYRAHLRGARLFLAGSPVAVERRPDARLEGTSTTERFYQAASRRVFIRRFRGGMLRALAYVALRIPSLFAKTLWNLILVPVGGGKKMRKAAFCVARIRGLFWGLVMPPSAFAGFVENPS